MPNNSCCTHPPEKCQPKIFDKRYLACSRSVALYSRPCLSLCSEDLCRLVVFTRWLSCIVRCSNMDQIMTLAHYAWTTEIPYCLRGRLSNKWAPLNVSSPKDPFRLFFPRRTVSGQGSHRNFIVVALQQYFSKLYRSSKCYRPSFLFSIPTRQMIHYISSRKSLVYYSCFSPYVFHNRTQRNRWTVTPGLVFFLAVMARGKALRQIIKLMRRKYFKRRKTRITLPTRMTLKSRLIQRSIWKVEGMCVRDCTEYSHDVDVQTCFLYLDVIGYLERSMFSWGMCIPVLGCCCFWSLFHEYLLILFYREVYVDPETDVPYDILMSKVDVKYGMFGLNNFYKMQVRSSYFCLVAVERTWKTICPVTFGKDQRRHLSLSSYITSLLAIVRGVKRCVISLGVEHTFTLRGGR